MTGRCRIALVVLIVGLSGIAVQRASSDDLPRSCPIELSYEEVEGLPLLRVEVGGPPSLTFLLDSGATTTTLHDDGMAIALGLELRGEGLARGVGRGAREVAIAGGVSIRAEGLEILRADIAVRKISQPIFIGNRRLDGLLGAELFDRYVVEIDSLGNRLLLHDPKAWVAPPGSWLIPLDKKARRPVVEARLPKGKRRKQRLSLLVDTGSSGELMLIEAFDGGLRRPDDAVIGGAIGIGGRAVIYHSQIEGLELGTLRLASVNCAWLPRVAAPAVALVGDLDGIVGLGLFSRFDVAIDRSRNQMVLSER